MANAAAPTADSSPSNHSLRPSNTSGEGSQLRRNSGGLPSPWSHVVRGSESEPPSTAPDPLPDSNRCLAKPCTSDSVASDATVEVTDNGVPAKKLAWKTPSNGVVEVGPVMGAVSWPPLSESAKASAKSSSDLPVSASTQVPVITSSPKKSVINNQNPNTNPTAAHVSPVRQKSNDPDTPRKSSGKPAAGIPESSPQTKNNNWETGSRGGYSGNDQHRNSHRRGNGGPHHHNNYGNRRDQERANYERNHPPRGFGGRDVHMQQQRGIPRGFMRAPPPPPPPPTSTPYVGRPPVRPFGNPIGFHDMHSQLYYFPAPPPESLRALPFIAHSTPPPLFFPPPDQRTMVAKQIEYYFSPDNLCKDLFLRRKMDEQGWVLVSVIAKFNRVMQLSNNIQFILDAVRTSSMLEVQGDKIRKRNDWMNWVLPPSSSAFATTSSSQSPTTSNSDTLATRIQSIEIQGTTDNNSSRIPAVEIPTERVLSRSSSGELNSNSLSQANTPSGISNWEGTGQISVQMGSERSMSERNTGESQVC